MRDIDPLSTAVAERLRALPERKVEPYGWEEFRRRTSAARDDAQRAASVLSLRAAAAILLLAGATALAAWMWGGSARPARPSIATGASSSTLAAAREARGSSDPVDDRTRAMEVWLARQSAEPAMVRVGAYATEAGLEDRIAQLDDLLTAARGAGVGSASLSPLEEQRARLVSSLVQVRFAETLVSESPR